MVQALKKNILQNISKNPLFTGDFLYLLTKLVYYDIMFVLLSNG